MRWYADNSELNGIRGAGIPDILLFGGIAVPPESDTPLRNAVECVKARYGHARAPVKWNFKDLQPLYKAQGMDALYADLLSKSKTWREEIFREICRIDFTIILACIESHSLATKVIKGTKPDLTRFVFSNGLMRLALHVIEKKPERTQVVLDWPDKGISKPFDAEYSSAYNYGKTHDGSVSYHSGPLNKLGFSDSTVYANMHHSTLLQLADLIIGASREMIECAIGKKSTGFGVDMAKIVASHYRGYKGRIYGRGISVASGDPAFKGAVKAYVNTVLS